MKIVNMKMFFDYWNAGDKENAIRCLYDIIDSKYNSDFSKAYRYLGLMNLYGEVNDPDFNSKEYFKDDEYAAYMQYYGAFSPKNLGEVWRLIHYLTGYSYNSEISETILCYFLEAKILSSNDAEQYFEKNPLEELKEEYKKRFGASWGYYFTHIESFYKIIHKKTAIDYFEKLVQRWDLKDVLSLEYKFFFDEMIQKFHDKDAKYVLARLYLKADKENQALKLFEELAKEQYIGAEKFLKDTNKKGGNRYE